MNPETPGSAFLSLLPTLPTPLKKAMAFLAQTLPQSDLDSYPPALFLSFCEHALTLRESAGWCRTLDEELFLHYVLFPRINDEDLSDHRALFHAALWPRVRGLCEEEAVLETNRWCHEQASYQMQDERTASPLTVFRSGSGRCGEESAFLVAALRSIGIAARQVYAPRWAHCDDNHAWVEALCGGRWRFLGACEPEPELDRGWFNAAAGRAVLIHSRLFAPGSHPLHGELIEDTPGTGGVYWYNQTARYAAVFSRTLRVRAPEGRPIPGARLTLSLLNEAALRPIAHLSTDSKGAARIQLGAGDLFVSASAGEGVAEGLLPFEQPSLDLVLRPRAGQAAEEGWLPFSFRAPAPGPLPPPLPEAQRPARQEVLARGEAKRRKKLAALFDPSRAKRLPEAEGLLREARGNFEEVFRFLTRDRCPWRQKLLNALTPKDLRDLKADILEEHLQGALPFAGQFPEEVFTRWLLSPRIGLEPLRAWRGVLSTAPLQPQVSPAGRNYPSLVWPPDCAFAAGRCGPHSRDILSVALLRAHGIPARLRALDGAPERWQEGRFVPLTPEAQGTLTLTGPQDSAPLPGRDWSLARFRADGWQDLRPDGQWEKGRYRLQLAAGRYRLLTSVRLPSGDQLAARREFSIRAGEATEIPLFFQSSKLRQLLYCRSLPPVAARDMRGRQDPSCIPANGRPSLLVWLEEGAEPTEHLLHELKEAGPVDGGLVLFLRGEESLAHPALQRHLPALPKAQIRFGDWAYDLEQLARLLGCDPERPPLAIVCDGQGRAAYAESGYRVGMAQLLQRMLKEL